jgi:hypothetical protein
MVREEYKVNIIGQYVTHKSFGIGKIIGYANNLIAVSFPIGEKKFILPDAFGTFLYATDSSFSEYIEVMKSDKEKSYLEEKEKKLEELKSTAINKSKTYSNSYKKPFQANIAFKCNYCDGGKSDKQVGFQGVCSDEVIHNNIAIDKRTWCSSDDSTCLDYFNGDISREELDELCDEDGFVCYESQMLRDWRALAGIVQNGDRKGERMKLHQIERNSLCILTTRNPRSKESDRYIFAVFLIDDIYEGDSENEGYVSSSSKYRLKLSPNEAQKMLLWNYHANQKKPEKATWSSGLHRYFNDDIAVQILSDIVELKRGTTDFELAEEFLNHLCEINGITEIKEPYGALRRS